MRILLIAPPFYRILGYYNRYFPFGITFLGAVLKKRGDDVLVYDADFCEHPENIDYASLPRKYPLYLKSFSDKNNFVWEEMKKVITDFKPDVVGISVFTTFAASAFHVAKMVKKIYPSCPVVMGGPHATSKSDEILKICNEVDFVVRGDGEESLPELLEVLSGKKRNFGQILGLSWRGKNKTIRNNKVRPFNKKIDDYPIPDRSLLKNEKKLSSEDMGLMMTSRGCPYRCTYCASTKGLALRSVDNVIKEIEEVKLKYGTTQFTFKDDSFTVDRDRVVRLCQQIIDRKLNIKWECNTRINLIDKELLVLIKKAGCNFIKVGIESGSAKILKLMKKDITLGQIRKVAKLLREVGIHWTGYFMMGVVGEKEKDIYKTLDLVHEIKPDLALIGVYEPFPGTVMFNEGLKRDLVTESMSLKDFYSVMPNNYYKVDPNIQTDTISPERFSEIEIEVKEGFRKYNMRGGNILRMAWSKIDVYLREPKIFMEDFQKFKKYAWSKKS